MGNTESKLTKQNNT